MATSNIHFRTITYLFSKKYRYESTALVLRDQIDIWQW